LIGFVTLVVYATFPETAYNRNFAPTGTITTLSPSGNRIRRSVKGEEAGVGETAEIEVAPQDANVDSSPGFKQGLRLYHGKFTHESLWKMIIRPVGLLILPPVLWATLVMSVTIGFITAITSNVSSAFSTAYGFEAWQSGLCFVSAIIGCAFGILLGGNFSDWVADYFTRRNGGIREPEMRLPAIMVGAITGPLALALYGCGIKWQMHWIVPTIGIGLSKSLNLLSFFDPLLIEMLILFSQFHYHSSYQCLPCVHHRQLSPHCWRNCRYPTSFQVCLRLPARLLHKPLGGNPRLQYRIRRDGCHLWRRSYLLDSVLHLGQNDSPNYPQLVCDEVGTMG
jgi:hypothetical protein